MPLSTRNFKNQEICKDLDKIEKNKTSLLSFINWFNLSEKIRQELHSRERKTPVISAFRWWARRPHYLMGAILEAARIFYGRETIRVTDPFGGGGTVAVEAARRHIPVYIQELYPWPIFGLSTALKSINPQEFEEASQSLLHILKPLRWAYIRSDGRELTHIIRVRRGTCPRCTNNVYLFPQPMISLASRRAKEKCAYYGCIACGAVYIGSITDSPKNCPSCQLSYPGRPGRGQFICPHCNYKGLIKDFLGHSVSWHPILVQEVVNGRRILREIEPEDPVDVQPASVVYHELCRPIPPGVETRHLLAHGFRTWGDLYPERQAAVLLTGLRQVQKIISPVRDHLALAILGATEMAGFLARWDRYHLKAIEIIAHHRYAYTTISVETNLLSSFGRGTLPRRFQQIKKIIQWVNQEIGPKMRIYVVRDRQPRLSLEDCCIYLAMGSSTQQALRGNIVDLVLTDPPYHDDIQYGELASLFHFWLSLYQNIPLVEEAEEATPNTIRGRDTQHYENIITRCLKECRRSLSKEGRLVFTFRNRDLRAWQALCSALWQAGFCIHGVAVVKTNDSLDPTRKSSKTMQYDLILECRIKGGHPYKHIFIWADKSSEAKALKAMGLAMAESLQQDNPEGLFENYKKWHKRFNVKIEWIKRKNY